MTVEQLSWYIDNTVAKELLSVPGMAAVNRNGGVDREIRVILDPLKLQARGSPRARSTSSSAQVNLNAAGGRAEIAGSEQSVRVLGNATDARTQLGADPDLAVGSGRTVRLADIAQVRDSLCRTAQPLAKLDGRQVISFDFQRAKGASDVTVFHEACEEAARRSKSATRDVHFVLRSNKRSNTPKKQYEIGDRGDDRGRGARGHRRVPVPARLARDGDLGAGDPAVGDPDLLVHGPARLHPQPA